MEYVRIPEIISAFSGRDSSRVRHLAIFYQNDQLLPVTHPTFVDNPIAISPLVPSSRRRAIALLQQSPDPTSWDEKPIHTNIGINIKHNLN